MPLSAPLSGALVERRGRILSAGPARGIRGVALVPGDKSISHRALILGALAAGLTRIDGLLESEDVGRTIAALRSFGITVEKTVDGAWQVLGGEWHSPTTEIDCGNSGTTARLLMGAAANFNIEATFIGDPSLSARPMGRVIEPLRRMGVIPKPARADTLPVTLRSRPLFGIRHHSKSPSAQVKSAILLAGLRARGDVEIVEPASTRDHTERMLRLFGCDVKTHREGNQTVVSLGCARFLRGSNVRIPADPSSAAFPLVAALITPDSEVTVRQMMINPYRDGLFTTLADMGADLTIEGRIGLGSEIVACVRARSSRLRGVVVPRDRAPSMIDEYPILAAAAACAEGPTVMRGLGELRFKESDRLSAIVQGLEACGVAAQVDGDDLVVEGCPGGPEGGGLVDSFRDHRIAMAFLVLGLACRNAVRVNNSHIIGTSFPRFAEIMNSLGSSIEYSE